MNAREEAGLAHLLALSPPGGAFPRGRDSNWARALAPLAAEHTRVETEAEALLPEVDPGRAALLLPDYERVLGDDPCLGSSAALPLNIRQSLARQRWTNRGGATPAYFIALAAAIGVAITITESDPHACGVFECGEELVPEAGRFEWIVNLPATSLLEFEAGATEAGSRDVANLFRILQRHYVPFMDLLRWQVTSRAEFERLKAAVPDTLTDLERAARFLYLQRLAFGGQGAGAELRDRAGRGGEV